MSQPFTATEAGQEELLQRLWPLVLVALPVGVPLLQLLVGVGVLLLQLPMQVLPMQVLPMRTSS